MEILNLKRKPDENEREYIWRLGNEKDEGCLIDLSWDDLAEIINEELYGDNKQLYKNSASFRKPYQSAKSYFTDVFSKCSSPLYSDGFTEELHKLERKKDELQKERVKLQDANREKRKFLREHSRTEVMLDYLKECIEKAPKIKMKKCNYEYGTNLEASLLISDIHMSAKVDNIYNYYDEETLIERLGQLKDKVIAICQKDEIDYLNIELLGDFITGLIHGSTIAESNDDIVSQIVKISEILSNFIAQIAENVPNVKVYSVFGNHDRSCKNKSDAPNKENFGRLIPEYIRLKLPNIKVIDSKYEDHLSYKLNDGRIIVMSHGDKDNINNAMSHFLSLLREDIFEIHLAHYHSFAENEGVVVNGSLMGADDYAIGLRKNSKPIQALRVYGEDVSCYKLTLD